MKISIITATYNSSKNLERCINSVFWQKDVIKEHIIIDGLSKDETVDIIKRNEEKFSFWVSERDNGIYDAINKGIKNATGDLIALLHSDDFLKDEFVLSKIVFLMKKYEADVLFSELVYIKNDIDVNADIHPKIVRNWKAIEVKVG